MKPRAVHPGFTLLELVLVMLIMATGLAVAAPSLQGWSRGSQLRNQADQLVSVTRFARTRAIADSTTYRLNIDPAANTYHLTMQSGQQFVQPESKEWGKTFQLQDATIRLSSGTVGASGVANTIDFLPDGRTQEATIELQSTRSGTISIQCASPTDVFAITAGGAS